MKMIFETLWNEFISFGTVFNLNNLMELMKLLQAFNIIIKGENKGVEANLAENWCLLSQFDQCDINFSFLINMP